MEVTTPDAQATPADAPYPLILCMNKAYLSAESAVQTLTMKPSPDLPRMHSSSRSSYSQNADDIVQLGVDHVASDASRCISEYRVAESDLSSSVKTEHDPGALFINSQTINPDSLGETLTTIKSEQDAETALHTAYIDWEVDTDILGTSETQIDSEILTSIKAEQNTDNELESQTTDSASESDTATYQVHRDKTSTEILTDIKSEHDTDNEIGLQSVDIESDMDVETTYTCEDAQIRNALKSEAGSTFEVDHSYCIPPVMADSTPLEINIELANRNKLRSKNVQKVVSKQPMKNTVKTNANHCKLANRKKSQTKIASQKIQSSPLTKDDGRTTAYHCNKTPVLSVNDSDHVKRFECYTCQKCFKAISSLKTHITRSHIGTEGYRFSCKMCHRRFKDIVRLKKHAMHPCDERRVSCSKCPQTFDRDEDRKEHMKTYHKQLFICSKCPQRFDTNEDRKEHMKIHHRQIFICSKCPQRFDRNEERKEHMKIHRQKASKSGYIACTQSLRTIEDNEKHKLLNLELDELLNHPHVQKPSKKVGNKETVRTEADVSPGHKTSNVHVNDEGDVMQVKPQDSQGQLSQGDKRRGTQHNRIGKTVQYSQKQNVKNLYRCLDCGAYFALKNTLFAHRKLGCCWKKNVGKDSLEQNIEEPASTKQKRGRTMSLNKVPVHIVTSHNMAEHEDASHHVLGDEDASRHVLGDEDASHHVLGDEDASHYVLGEDASQNMAVNETVYHDIASHKVLCQNYVPQNTNMQKAEMQNASSQGEEHIAVEQKPVSLKSQNASQQNTYIISQQGTTQTARSSATQKTQITPLNFQKPMVPTILGHNSANGLVLVQYKTIDGKCIPAILETTKHPVLTTSTSNSNTLSSHSQETSLLRPGVIIQNKTPTPSQGGARHSVSTGTKTSAFHEMLLYQQQKWEEKRHLKQQRKQQKTTEKPFKCQLCGCRFPSEPRLKNHARVHTGERPFKCDVCRRSFSHANVLYYHKRTHSGEKPYMCDICGRSFSLQYNLVTGDELCYY